VGKAYESFIHPVCRRAKGIKRNAADELLTKPSILYLSPFTGKQVTERFLHTFSMKGGGCTGLIWHLRLAHGFY
jgi:hypothetical protein